MLPFFAASAAENSDSARYGSFRTDNISNAAIRPQQQQQQPFDNMAVNGFVQPFLLHSLRNPPIANTHTVHDSETTFPSAIDGRCSHTDSSSQNPIPYAGDRNQNTFATVHASEHSIHVSSESSLGSLSASSPCASTVEQSSAAGPFSTCVPEKYTGTVSARGPAMSGQTANSNIAAFSQHPHNGSIQQQQQQQQLLLRTPSFALRSNRPKTGKRCLGVHFTPTDTTIVCGRGKYSQSSGNLRLKNIVRELLDEYTDAKSRTEKSAIVSTIFARVKHGCSEAFVADDASSQQQQQQLSAEALFVKIHKGVWWEVEDSVAREKVGCILREEMYNAARTQSAGRTGSKSASAPTKVRRAVASPSNSHSSTSVAMLSRPSVGPTPLAATPGIGQGSALPTAYQPASSVDKESSGVFQNDILDPVDASLVAMLSDPRSDSRGRMPHDQFDMYSTDGTATAARSRCMDPVSRDKSSGRKKVASEEISPGRPSFALSEASCSRKRQRSCTPANCGTDDLPEQKYPRTLHHHRQSVGRGRSTHSHFLRTLDIGGRMDGRESSTKPLDDGPLDVNLRIMDIAVRQMPVVEADGRENCGDLLPDDLSGIFDT